MANKLESRKMLNVLSGQQTANIKSFPVAEGVEVNQGDWVKFDDNGKLVKQTGAYDGTYAVFPVYAGNIIFYDTQYLNRVDVVTAKSCVLETDNMAAVNFKAGDRVFVKAGALINYDSLETAEKSTAVPVGFAIEASGVNVRGKNIVKFQMA